jgi:hypothetical protein
MLCEFIGENAEHSNGDAGDGTACRSYGRADFGARHRTQTAYWYHPYRVTGWGPGELDGDSVQQVLLKNVQILTTSCWPGDIFRSACTSTPNSADPSAV